MDKMENIGQALVERFNKIKANRTTHENVFRDIDKYILNTPSTFSTTSLSGQVVGDDISDTTGVVSNSMLAAVIHSQLTNTAKKWFTLTPTNVALKNIPKVKRWAAHATNVLVDIFNSTGSNFPQQNHEFTTSLTSYGTACMYIDADRKGNIRFTTRHLSEIFIAEDFSGIVDTVFRLFEYSARNAIQDFGEEACGPKIVEAAKKDPDKKFKFVHCCMSTDDAELIYGDELNLSEIFEYVAYTVCLDDKRVIKRDGYEMQPYIVARFEKLPSEIYGRSPAWKVLPNIKMVNRMMDAIIDSVELTVNPPMGLPDDGIITQLDMTPNGLNVGAVSPEGRQLVVPIQMGGRIDLGEHVVEKEREAIRRGYFVSQFTQKEGTPISATEFAQRSSDELALGSPNLFRLRAEGLNKIIARTFQLAYKNKLIDPVPQEMLNEKGELNYSIEYSNPTVKQQLLDELTSVGKAFQAGAPLVQLDPTTADILDKDSLFKFICETAGVPLESIREVESKKPLTLEQYRQQRQEQQQMMMQQQSQADAFASGNLPTQQA